MLKFSSPVPINPAVAHLCVSALPGPRGTGCTGGFANQSCPKKEPLCPGDEQQGEQLQERAVTEATASRSLLHLLGKLIENG